MLDRNDIKRHETHLTLNVHSSDVTLNAYAAYEMLPQRSISSALAVPSAKLTGASCELTVAAVLLTGLYGASGQWALDRYRRHRRIDSVITFYHMN